MLSGCVPWLPTTQLFAHAEDDNRTEHGFIIGGVLGAQKRDEQLDTLLLSFLCRVWISHVSSCV